MEDLNESQKNQKYKAIVFDMDGVLLDTERFELDISNEVLKKSNLKISDKLYMSACSVPGSEYEKLLKREFGEQFDFSLFKTEVSSKIYKWTAQNGIPLKTRVKESLEFLKEHGFRLAVATSTSANKAKKYLQETGIINFFEVICCGDMVVHSKPFPDVYLMAASKLSLKPYECMAVEDSANGLTSAFSAGFNVSIVPDIGVPDTALIEKCAYRADSLFELVRMITINN